jgi:hypothetical protein
MSEYKYIDYVAWGLVWQFFRSFLPTHQNGGYGDIKLILRDQQSHIGLQELAVRVRTRLFMLNMKNKYLCSTFGKERGNLKVTR